MPRSRDRRRWLIAPSGPHWAVFLGGVGLEGRLEQVDAEAYVKEHLIEGDTVFRQEPDGYLTNITRSIGKARSRHWRAAER